MGEETKIEWCDHSWSPWRGCTKVSPGCAHCYAETLSKRNPAVLGQWGKGKPRVLAKNWNEPVRWNKAAAEDLRCLVCGATTFDGQVNADGYCSKCELDAHPTRSTVFPSLCDWLDDEVPVEWLAKFLQLIHATPNLTWLLLTKRPENFYKRLDACVTAWWRGEIEDVPEVRRRVSGWLMKSSPDAPSNVWVGTSVEDQTRANERIPALLKIPAVGRFLSVEPLLGPVDLEPFMQHGRDITDEGYSRLDGINWVIIGGESGPRARPCNIKWIRSIVHQCQDASVPVFVKQLGSRPILNPCRQHHFDWRHKTANADRLDDALFKEDIGAPGMWRILLTHPKGGDPAEWPYDLRVREFPEGLR